MTASRLVALTLGELRRTSDTSDLDTPARAATVSRVGFRAVWPAAATWPSSVRLGALQPYECAEMVSTASARRATPVTSVSFLTSGPGSEPRRCDSAVVRTTAM